LEDIQNVPDSVKQQFYRLDAEETAAEEPRPVEEAKRSAEQPLAANSREERVRGDHEEGLFTNASHPQQTSEEVDDREPTLEELVAGDVEKDMVDIKKVALKPKEFIDDDGFTHVKPHERSEFEHNVLRGKGRRGGRKGDTERLKVRGGKGPRGIRGHGRGGRNNDKYGADDQGKKLKNAHGKHPKSGKGQVRVTNVE